MLFQHTEDQELLADTLSRFVADQIRPHAGTWSTAQGIPLDLYHGLRDLGLFGLDLKPEVGGAGFGTSEWVQAVATLAEGDAGLALSVVTHGAVLSALQADARQEHACFHQLAQGQLLGTVAWVDGQGEVFKVSANEKGYALNGRKEAVPMIAHADRVLVRGFVQGEESLFILPTNVPGLTLLPSLSVLGLRSAGFGSATFENVFVAEEFKLDRGTALAAQTRLDLGLASIGVGLGASSLHEGATYGMQRKQFGKSIAMFQANQFKLADMATHNEAARLLVMRAALSSRPRDIQMARVFALESAFVAADHALQLHGGFGYTQEFPVERLFRDTQFSTALFRTGDMLRVDIANQLLREI